MKKQNVTKNLWPKIDSIATDSPIRIQKEQADLFNAQMKGLLKCTLERERKSDSIFDRSYDYIASLNISTPALNDFSLRLIEVKYLVAETYPCNVFNCIEDKYHKNEQKAEEAKDFNYILKSILNSHWVKNALQNMLAQDI